MAESFSGRVELEGKSGADRRRATRVDKAFVINYQVVALPDEKTLLETLDKLLTGESKDLSEVGISMWTGKMLMPGTTIEMEFPASGTATAVKVKARVVWCQPHTEGGYVRSRAGLEFVDVNPEDRARLVAIIKAEDARNAA